MSLYGAFDQTKHLDELASPLDHQEGVLSPAARRERTLQNLLGDTDIVVADVTKLADVDATAAEINAAADVSARLVSVPDGTAYTVLTANSGKPHVIPDQTASVTLTLPAASAGLEYEFIYGGVAADAQNWVVDTGSDTNYFMGGLIHADTAANDAGDEIVPIAGNGSSNSKLTVVTPDVGSRIHLVSDGTLWYLSGTVASATVPSFADQ